MSRWRPDGWKNPYRSETYGKEVDPQHFGFNTWDGGVFETGADAILEALRKDENAFNIPGTKAVKIHVQEIPAGAAFGTVVHGKGTLVFIPDDEVKK